MAEQDILLKLRQKDPKGVELMIDAYGVIVYKLVARILQDLGREDIEECCSDVFLAAWNKSNQFDPERGSMRTWLLMLARYTALDYRRRFAKEKAVQNAKLWETAAGGLSPEEMLLQKEQNEQLLNLLASLSLQEKEVVYRFYFLDEDIRQIASELNLSRGAVDTRLWRARRSLKELLKSPAKKGGAFK